jgi:hypothetical protein
VQRNGILNVLTLHVQSRTALFRACVDGTTVTGAVNTDAIKRCNVIYAGLADQYTPRRCACVLIDAGANPDARDLDGLAIVHCLASSWRHETLQVLWNSLEQLCLFVGFQLLLSRGADANIPLQATRQSPLHVACACEVLGADASTRDLLAGKAFHDKHLVFASCVFVWLFES